MSVDWKSLYRSLADNLAEMDFASKHDCFMVDLEDIVPHNAKMTERLHEFCYAIFKRWDACDFIITHSVRVFYEEYDHLIVCEIEAVKYLPETCWDDEDDDLKVFIEAQDQDSEEDDSDEDCDEFKGQLAEAESE